MEHTETLIVEQLKTGNEDAYQYIYDRHPINILFIVFILFINYWVA